MSSKQTGPGGGKGGGIAKEKMIPVAEGSQQAKTPGAAPSVRGSEQSVRQEDGIGERGGPGAQQTGWSARQQAERMKARAEEERLGKPRQSGYGGAEQSQHAGSQESPTGPAGSQQSGSRQGGGKPSEQ